MSICLVIINMRLPTCSYLYGMIYGIITCTHIETSRNAKKSCYPINVLTKGGQPRVTTSIQWNINQQHNYIFSSKYNFLVDIEPSFPTSSLSGWHRRNHRLMPPPPPPGFLYLAAARAQRKKLVWVQGAKQCSGEAYSQALVCCGCSSITRLVEGSSLSAVLASRRSDPALLGVDLRGAERSEWLEGGE
jgi:hypothetical protein